MLTFDHYKVYSYDAGCVGSCFSARGVSVAADSALSFCLCSVGLDIFDSPAY